MSTVDTFIQQGLSAIENKAYDDANILFSQAIHLVPDHPLAHFFLGNVLCLKEHFQQAITHFKKALEITPSNPLIHYNLGNVFKYLGKWEESIKNYQKSLELHPDYYEAYLNLANVFRSIGEFEKAEHYYKQSLTRSPDNIDILNNLGLMKYLQKNYTEALEFFASILELEPNNAQILQNKAHILMDMGQKQAALEIYHKVFQLNPSLNTLNHLGLLHIQYGEVDQALHYFQQVIQQAGKALNMYSPWLFSIQYLINIKPSSVLKLHHDWGDLVQQHTPFTFNHEPKKQSDKIKIGYLSPDFRLHSAAHFLKPFLRNIPDSFEVYCYSDNQMIDNYTREFQKLVKNWRFTSALSNESLAQLIYDDQIDILVDPGVGHAGGNRLLVFAQQPAPIQVTFYPFTTGLRAINYRVTDKFLDPSTSNSPEELCYMPHSIFCYSPPKPSPAPNSLPFNTNGFITFGSCNRLAKINQGTLKVWSQILLNLPESRLMLKDRAFLSTDCCETLLSFFESEGISRERIELKPYVNSPYKHLEFYHQVDINLDPFPFGGHISSLESLWMGIPSITLKGSSHFGRVTHAFLQTLNLAEWSTDNARDYVQQAITLANQTENLNHLRASLREKLIQSPICDEKQYSKDIYQLFSTLQSNHTLKKLP